MKRTMVWILVSVAVVFVGAALATGCALSAPGWRGPPSDNFDGRRFHNVGGIEPLGFGSLLAWISNRDEGYWREWTEAPYGPPPPPRVSGGVARVTFVNHATLLLQVDGVNVLTDPIWSERASPFSWVGPRRRRPPGIRFEDLPPIDAIVVSHNHYDHMDLPTLRALALRDRPAILVGLGNGALLHREGVPGGLELDWWSSHTLRTGMRITSVPVQHFSGRGLTDRNATLWTGWVLETAGGPIFFAGDTGYGPALEQIAERWAPLRLALLPIGAYLPVWFMNAVHITPGEAVKLHRLLKARTSIAMHFGTFPLADDGEDQPPRDLEMALHAAGVATEEFWVLKHGEGRDLPGP